eukprot:6195641-Pleurochrysis_carterae.AAC.5
MHRKQHIADSLLALIADDGTSCVFGCLLLLARADTLPENLVAPERTKSRRGASDLCDVNAESE